MFAVQEMYGALTRPPTTSSQSHPHHLGDYRPDGYDAMGQGDVGDDDYDDDDSYGPSAAVTVLAVVMVDQFGVAHAPPGEEHSMSSRIFNPHNTFSE